MSVFCVYFSFDFDILIFIVYLFYFMYIYIWIGTYVGCSMDLQVH